MTPAMNFIRSSFQLNTLTVTSIIAVSTKYVATLPEVVNYHDEHVQMGGSGITVVEFR